MTVSGGTILYADKGDGLGLGTGKLTFSGGALKNTASETVSLDNPLTAIGGG